MARESFFAIISLAIMAGVVIGSPSRKAGSVLVSKHGEALKACRDNWSNLDNSDIGECIRKLVISARGPLMTNPQGIPALRLPNISPLMVEEVPIEGSGLVEGVARNVEVYGLGEGFDEDSLLVEFPAGEDTVTIMGKVKSAKVKGEYDLNVNIMRLFDPTSTAPGANSEGAFAGTLYDAVVLIKLKMEMGKRGKKIAKITVDMDYNNVQDVTFEANNPDDTIATLMTNAAGDQNTVKTIFNEIKPKVSHMLAEMFYRLVKSGIRKLDKW